MATPKKHDELVDHWARFRFSIIGPLLAGPPEEGDLRITLRHLAEKTFKHPISGQPVTFAVSTIERWFYAARNSNNPIVALRRRVRSDAGTHRRLTLALRTAIRGLYKGHKTWSYQLHYDNLAVLAEEDPTLQPLVSYATVRRWMKSQAMRRMRRIRSRHTPGVEAAEQRLEDRDTRSYEMPHVHALWHADFHACSRKIVLPSGRWVTPHVLGVLDDRSRLACHVQWYLDETAESFVHGLCQAFQKRGLPRALLTDNGSAMIAEETTTGLEDISVTHDTTLPYSPHQNGKQESFRGPLEGRLVSMLDGVKDLTLQTLNEATQAWVELEYNKKRHDEIGTAPINRYLDDPNVGRECPPSEQLRVAFTIKTSRAQRHSDGTITVEGVRFEVPSRYRALQRVCVRYARWDLSSIHLVDEKTFKVLATLLPLDKQKNADGRRRSLEPIGDVDEDGSSIPPASGIAPLLRKLMEKYAATGLPPAYIPKNDDE